ncbi:MFS transporter [Nonomuraea endophytica]|uniref:MFS transporter n=1 Tax=Nonomuraea endophytica TaxID=714136 RepID=UPI0037C60EA7
MSSPDLAMPETGRKVPAGFITVHFLALLGAWVGVMTPASVGVAVTLERIDPEGKVAALSWAFGLGALVAVLANPLFGLLSDRCTSRYGARRPWMVVGTAGGMAGLLVIATAASTIQVIIGWCIAQAMYNALVASVYGVLADQVPERQTGTVAAVLAIAMPVALLAGTFLVDLFNTSPFWLVIAPALLGAVLVIPFLVYGRDRRIEKDSVPALRARELARFLWTNPIKHRDFGWAWLSRFMMWSAFTPLSVYMAYYLGDYLKLSGDEVTRHIFLAFLVSNICILLATVPAGWLSDRIGRRKPLVLVAAILFGGGLLLVATAQSVTAFLVAQVALGLGQGVYYAVDIALPADVLPDPATAAKDLGVMNIAATIPGSLVPLFAPAVLAVGAGNNYPLLFLIGLGFAALAVVTVLPVRRR